MGLSIWRISSRSPGVFGTTCEDRPDVSVGGDREALIALFNATDGPNWVNKENWLTDATLGEWYGVETNASGRVVALGLGGRWDDNACRVVGHGLPGKIPPELARLAELRTLSLYSNNLVGIIPPELSELPQLIQLRLEDNALSGQIPSELGRLAQLQTLTLDRNLLTGPIPPELGNLALLSTLRLVPFDG